jgi:hypothetical protein
MRAKDQLKMIAQEIDRTADERMHTCDDDYDRQQLWEVVITDDGTGKALARGQVRLQNVPLPAAGGTQPKRKRAAASGSKTAASVGAIFTSPHTIPSSGPAPTTINAPLLAWRMRSMPSRKGVPGATAASASGWRCCGCAARFCPPPTRRSD